MSTIDRIGIRRVAVERATVISGQSFDTVLAKLAAAVGHPDMSAFARDVVAARTSADLERIVEAATGPAGLVEMAHFDIGDVLRNELGDRAPKSVRLVIGNPLIMKERVKHLFQMRRRMPLGRFGESSTEADATAAAANALATTGLKKVSHIGSLTAT